MFHCHAFNIEPDRGSEHLFLSLSCGIIFDAKHPNFFSKFGVRGGGGD